jgi:hypothetical protein
MKLSEIEHRILALEHALRNLQQCPADPCHVHYTAAEPKPDITSENWRHLGGVVFLVGESSANVCYAPYGGGKGFKHWPQRRVLIAHAPEMYRLLARLSDDGGTDAVWQDVANILTKIEKELKENE